MDQSSQKLKMGQVQDSPVSTNMISNVCMIYHTVPNIPWSALTFLAHTKFQSFPIETFKIMFLSVCSPQTKNHWLFPWNEICNWHGLTEGGTYPKLPTQPKFFVHISNSYNSLIWSAWVASRRKIKTRTREKKVQFSTESWVFRWFAAWKLKFQY